MMSQTEFEVGVKHGEYLGEIIIGLLVISGGGSAIIGVVNTCKAVNFVAKTYKRVNSSPEQLLEDSINAINDAF
jgi:uncharacterized membrane protein